MTKVSRVPANLGGQLGLGWWEEFSGQLFAPQRLRCAFLCSRRRPPTADDDIRQCEERIELMPVLGQPAIPHFAVTE